MPLFQKNPLVVEAFQFQVVPDAQDQAADWPAWFIQASLLEPGTSGSVYSAQVVGAKRQWFVSTLEGTMEISENDYVIRGIKGEIYPCKPEIFEASYTSVPEEPIGIATNTFFNRLVNDVNAPPLEEPTAHSEFPEEIPVSTIDDDEVVPEEARERAHTQE